MNKAPLLSPNDQWQIYDNEVSDELGRATLCQAQLDADHEEYTARIRRIFEEIENHKLTEVVTIQAKDATEVNTHIGLNMFAMDWWQTLKARFLEDEHD